MGKKDIIKKEKGGEKADSFTVTNAMLKTFNLFLNIPLHSEQAVARNKVINLIKEKFEEFEVNRLAIVKDHSKKDPKTGEMVMNEEGTNFIMKDIIAFNDAYEKLRQLPVVFDILPSNRQSWRIARDIIKSTKVEMDVEETEHWEKIIEALDTI